jgi:hypothetical protein
MHPVRIPSSRWERRVRPFLALKGSGIMDLGDAVCVSVSSRLASSPTANYLVKAN